MPSFFCMPLFACNRQVDSLDKRQCNLQAIPSDIERYARTLEELLLDMNHIKELPKSLFRLQKLRRLGLSDNDIHRLPPEISALMNLVELNLSRNDISDLPEDLRVCKQLLILDISSNPIARLPDSITQVTSLTHLSLNDTSLTKLPQDIGKLEALKSLEVRENHLRNLPQSISKLVNLVRFDLGQNELDDLPPEIGYMRSLQELYLDENSLESLPEGILRCGALEQLDASSNRLLGLPEELGELTSLTDMTLSHNCLTGLPSSIGRLKRLAILKVDDNNITSITPALGSCTALTELYLMQNLISELPNTVGNLSRLENLNLDKNQLTTLPPLIGNCLSLSVLSLRDNQVEELPMEIGKLENLRVLDLCNNRLSFLPYTVNVLSKLQALWLSENQSQAILKLQQDADPRTGIKVLTCYLLPQQSASVHDNNRVSNKAFVGGPKVHFGDMDGEPEEELHPPVDAETGNFSRHDTPHPKPHANILKHKKSVDGHVIPHETEQQPSTLALTKKVSEDRTNDPNVHGPRSALKHSSIHNIQDAIDKDRSVAFSVPTSAPDGESMECRLKRVNTPHYAKGFKLHNVNASSSSPSTTAATAGASGDGARSSSGSAAFQTNSGGTRQPPQRIQSPETVQTKRVIVRREPNTGLGLSIAGGIESTPWSKVDNDKGLFISRVVPGSPADRAGLLVGDKLIEVNGTSMVNQRHDTAVECMQLNADAVELVIRRQPLKAVSREPNQSKQDSSDSLLDRSCNERDGVEVISTTISAGLNGSLGFSVTGSEPDGVVFVSAISPDGAVARDGRVHVGDRILSINGTKVKGMRQAEVTALLSPGAHKEIYLVVERNKYLANGISAAPPTGSMLLPSATNGPSTSATYVASLPYGDTTLDGVEEEVELARDHRNALGLSVVGGTDHCSHPFGISKPGVFISKISTDSPAAKSRRLRIGDRIIAVNGRNLENARHNEAVEALKKSGPILHLGVRHEPQPKGLREVMVYRRPGEPIGLAICGGINSPPANPHDSTDEGIFVERVEPGSCADECKELRSGVRLLEVNDDSLLGCTKNEAAELLRKSSGSLRLLICDGFNRTSLATSSNSASDLSSNVLNGSRQGNHSSSFATSPPPTEAPPVLPPQLAKIAQGPANGLRPTPSPSFTPSFDAQPLATSSPIPPQIPPRSTTLPVTTAESTTFSSTSTSSLAKSPVTTFSTAPSSRVPPPVAPKPKLFSNGQNGFDRPKTDSDRIVTQRRSFEQETSGYLKKVNDDTSSSSITEETTRINGNGGGYGKVPPSDLTNTSFTSNSSEPSVRQIPIVVRTKKAENRLAAASPPLQPESPVDPTNIDIQKRREWRQARLASLEAEAVRAEQVMSRVQQISRLGNITEERSISTSPVNASATVRTSPPRGENGHGLNGDNKKGYSSASSPSENKEKSPILNAADIQFMDDDK
ncbi:PDZ-domain-containing protein scribble [Aphelenchoides avenae]|nr:PDZ-domain-containing protein scribble [Aphelenchus avenae]